MAQNITLLGASYSDVPAVTLPKTGGGTASFTDVTDTTAAAADVAAGKYFYTASGERVQGTASGGGVGGITQDQDGYLVLDDEAPSPTPSGGGLEYEEGTWSPAEDTANAVISFANTHTTAPFYYIIADTTGTYNSATSTGYLVTYSDFYQLFGESIDANNGGTFNYGIATSRYRTGTTSLGSASQAITTLTGDGDGEKARFWATETGIRAYLNSSSRYWRAGRTYKWIAVWAPTT